MVAPGMRTDSTPQARTPRAHRRAPRVQMGHRWPPFSPKRHAPPRDQTSPPALTLRRGYVSQKPTPERKTSGRIVAPHLPPERPRTQRAAQSNTRRRSQRVPRPQQNWTGRPTLKLATSTQRKSSSMLAPVESDDASQEWVEKAVGEPQEDWTSFDANRSLRIARFGSEGQIRRELRKLHIRWWHAGRTHVEQVLQHAGASPQALAQTPAIVDACKKCKAWSRPGPEPSPRIELAVRQNEQVETDLLFDRTYIIWRMIDRADRWHVATLVPTKTIDSLCEAMATPGIQIFGSFKALIIDGETGVGSAEGRAFLSRRGIPRRPRASGQHAHMIERRGAVLSHALDTAEEQLNTEGIAVVMRTLFAECVFAGNAFASHGGASPYNARFGRQPAMLPDLPAPAEEGPTGLTRDRNRLREIALQEIIQSAAQARIRRAMRGQSAAAGEALANEPGEHIDVYRPQSPKDTPGRHGPAAAIQNHPSRGLAVVRWNNREVLVRYADARRFLGFAARVHFPSKGPKAEAVQVLMSHMGHIVTCHPNSTKRTGTRHPPSPKGWAVTHASRTHRGVALAAAHIVRYVFQITNAFAVRFGRALKMLPNQSDATRRALIQRQHALEGRAAHEFAPAPTISMADVCGEHRQLYRSFQALCSDDGLGGMVQLLDEDAEQPTQSPTSAPASLVPLERQSRLSTIEDGEFEDGAESDRHPFDPTWVAQLEQRTQDGLKELMSDEYFSFGDLRTQEGNPREWPAQRPLAGPDVAIECLYHSRESGADPALLNTPDEYDAQGNWFVDFLFLNAGAPTTDEPRGLGQCGRIQIYAAAKRELVETGADLLTPAEYIIHAKAVAAAIYEDFIIWFNHGRFTRKLRTGARDILDTRWVGTWKWTRGKTDPDENVRTIRMRLTLRGFRDIEAVGLDTFAGVASRISQRIIVSEAAVQGWSHTALNVNKAFLKGVTYKELAQTTISQLEK